MSGQPTFNRQADARGPRARRPVLSGGLLLALLAVLLLLWADARSAAMQLAAMAGDAGAGMSVPASAASMPDCPDMPGMAEPAAGTPAGQPHQAPHHQPPCVVCAVAAHLPVPVALPPAVRFGAVWVVAFVHARAMRPRGPPAIRARARSPPTPVPDA